MGGYTNDGSATRLRYFRNISFVLACQKKVEFVPNLKFTWPNPFTGTHHEKGITLHGVSDGDSGSAHSSIKIGQGL